MTKRQEKIFGLSTLIMCCVTLFLTPNPSVDSLFSTHASIPMTTNHVSR
jgi:hypothetical protein